MRHKSNLCIHLICSYAFILYKCYTNITYLCGFFTTYNFALLLYYFLSENFPSYSSTKVRLPALLHVEETNVFR